MTISKLFQLLLDWIGKKLNPLQTQMLGLFGMKPAEKRSAIISERKRRTNDLIGWTCTYFDVPLPEMRPNNDDDTGIGNIDSPYDPSSPSDGSTRNFVCISIAHNLGPNICQHEFIWCTVLQHRSEWAILQQFASGGMFSTSCNLVHSALTFVFFCR